MANPVTVVARMRAAKGKGDALAALLREQAAAVLREEKACRMYRVHRSTQDPEAFLLYEIFDDAAAFDVHRQSRHVTEFRERREREGLSASAPDIEFFQAITQ